MKHASNLFITLLALLNSSLLYSFDKEFKENPTDYIKTLVIKSGSLTKNEPFKKAIIKQKNIYSAYWRLLSDIVYMGDRWHNVYGAESTGPLALPFFATMRIQAPDRFHDIVSGSFKTSISDDNQVTIHSHIREISNRRMHVEDRKYLDELEEKDIDSLSYRLFNFCLFTSYQEKKAWQTKDANTTCDITLKKIYKVGFLFARPQDTFVLKKELNAYCSTVTSLDDLWSNQPEN